MIIEVPGQVENQAWQMVAHIQKVDMQMPKKALQDTLRELAEQYLGQDLAPADADAKISQSLLRRGIRVSRLELRPLDTRQTSRREGLIAQWWEALIDDLATADGFGVTVDVVARAHLSAEVAQHNGCLLVLLSTLTAALHSELSNLFQNLDLESLLSRRKAWTSDLLGRIVEGNFDKILDQLHSEKIGPGHNAGLESLWITEMNVKARADAFRPQPRSRYGDPTAHFYFLSCGDPMHRSPEVDRE